MDMFDQISSMTKVQLIHQKRELWINTQYQATIDLRVALKIHDANLEQEARNMIRKSEEAIMEYDTVLKEIAINAKVKPETVQ